MVQESEAEARKGRTEEETKMLVKLETRTRERWLWIRRMHSYNEGTGHENHTSGTSIEDAPEEILTDGTTEQR